MSRANGSVMAMKKLSPTAEILLGIVREATQFDEGGEITRFFVPRTNPVREVYGKGIELGYIVGGAGDANALRALERAGLIKEMRAGSYWYAVTQDGVAEYDRIIARRQSK